MSLSNDWTPSPYPQQGTFIETMLMSAGILLVIFVMGWIGIWKENRKRG